MRKRIGEFLVEKGLLTPKQVQEVLEHSRVTGQRFGDAAMSLKLVTERQLVALFGANHRVNFFYVHPTLFPASTQHVFPVETLLRTGSLPLGSKTRYRFLRRKRVLNVGMLNPSRKDSLLELEALARAAGYDSVQVFLILASHCLTVLEKRYQLSAHHIRQLGSDKIDPTLGMFLETAEREEHARP
jgi:hypothetical protein